MSLRKVLRDLAKAVADEAERNPEFAERIRTILGDQITATKRRSASRSAGGTPAENKKRGNRRAPAILDPVALAAEGEVVVRSQLAPLDLEQLRDIVADYGMDPGKLVMKWKSPERVIDKIVEISLARARKGDAFRD